MACVGIPTGGIAVLCRARARVGMHFRKERIPMRLATHTATSKAIRASRGARRFVRAFTGVGVLCCAIASVSNASVVISDGIFNPADWSHSVLLSFPAASLGPMTQQLTGGNPAEYQRGRHVTQGPFASIYDGHEFVAGGSYNPSTQGAIASLDVSYDYIDEVGFGTQNGLMIMQGGRTFIHYVDSSGPFTAWTPHNFLGVTTPWNPNWTELTGGVATNFTVPDFSASGGPMTFGYYTFNWSLQQGFLVDNTWGIDNFRIEIHQVPAPAVAAMPVLVGVGVSLRRRR